MRSPERRGRRRRIAGIPSDEHGRRQSGSGTLPGRFTERFPRHRCLRRVKCQDRAVAVCRLPGGRITRTEMKKDRRTRGYLREAAIGRQIPLPDTEQDAIDWSPGQAIVDLREPTRWLRRKCRPAERDVPATDCSSQPLPLGRLCLPGFLAYPAAVEAPAAKR